MIAVYVAHFGHTALDAIELWSPEKLLAYFHKVSELKKIMGQ
ncbi:hypothetical protein [Agrobacterium cavarae]|nr:hypothetical protein [Agrobacterium cavarae]